MQQNMSKNLPKKMMDTNGKCSTKISKKEQNASNINSEAINKEMGISEIERFEITTMIKMSKH
jgi:hypothetical protein